ncbi:MAG: fasciclin domain-containing protein, partial [Tannerella sp.]|nr:fasciclin domain-containing protein [Tannerella sp.]
MKTKVSMLLLISAILPACNEEAIRDDAFYTFTGETIASFCENGENSLSIFARLIEESGTRPILSVYGHYTCFAPSDEAFEKYFEKEGITCDELSEEEKKKIVYDHVIKGTGTVYLSDFFEQGALPRPNMNDRELSISFVDDGDKQAIFVNNSAKITVKDNEVHNGVVHIINGVVKPSANHLLQTMEEAGYFKLFS